MIDKKSIKQILDEYDLDNITIGTLGGHSALDVCRGAKDEGFKTVVVAQKGREQTYTKYYKTKGGKGIVDNIIIVDKFSDITSEKVQKKLRKLNTIFIHSRYFWVYCDFKEIENNFLVPIFGTRRLLRAEERDQPKNQYYLLKKGKVSIPKIFKNAKDINCLAIVKAAEAARGYERAFFFVSNYKDYLQKSKKMLREKVITKESLDKAIIEEFVIGPQVNLNFFYSPLTKGLELLGTDTRRQTNLDGVLRLTAKEQLELLPLIKMKYIEQGHITVTLKESLLEQAFGIGEGFVKATQQEYSPGIIGAFALQGAVSAGPPKEKFVIFDVSMRIPGSPGTRYTPYSNYLYGKDISVGRRTAMEIRNAINQKKLLKVLT